MRLVTNTHQYVSNKQMGKLLESLQSQESNRKQYRTIAKIVYKDIRNMIIFKDLIVQKRNAGDIHLAIEDLITKYGDLSGFEWYCNETYIPNELVRESLANAVIILLDCLSEQLTRRFKNNEFCIFISIDLQEDRGITAHYYQLRDNEICFDQNIECIDQPVLYAYIHS